MKSTMDAAFDHAKSLAEYLRHCSSTYIIQISLKELGISSSREGFHLAKSSIRLLYENPTKTLTNGVYLAAALLCEYPAEDKQVEQAIRNAIKTAWKNRDEQIWSYYFPVGIPGRYKCPSNRDFLMAVVDFVELWKAFCEEGKHGQSE